MRKSIADQQDSTEQERLQELAILLARGVIRLRERRRAVGQPILRQTEERPPAGLEVRDETVLTVHPG